MEAEVRAIVLDTNVISELARLAPDPGVLSWLDSLEISDVATTAVTAAELRYGVARLPDGHRKRELTEVIRGVCCWEHRCMRLVRRPGALA